MRMRRERGGGLWQASVLLFCSLVWASIQILVVYFVIHSFISTEIWFDMIATVWIPPPPPPPVPTHSLSMAPEPRERGGGVCRPTGLPPSASLLSCPPQWRLGPGEG